jgi:hypothetical protein
MCFSFFWAGKSIENYHRTLKELYIVEKCKIGKERKAKDSYKQITEGIHSP